MIPINGNRTKYANNGIPFLPPPPRLLDVDCVPLMMPPLPPADGDDVDGAVERLIV